MLLMTNVWLVGLPITRRRNLFHLQTVPRCLAVYKRCFPPSAEEVVDQLMEDDRQRAPLRLSVPCLPDVPGEAAGRMLAFWIDRAVVVGSRFNNLDGRCLHVAEARAPSADDGILPFIAQSAGGPLLGHAGAFAAEGLSALAFKLGCTCEADCLFIFTVDFPGVRTCNGSSRTASSSAPSTFSACRLIYALPRRRATLQMLPA